jgi:hypothetical protein
VCAKGLGYRSQFVRDVTYSPEVVEQLSAMAGKPLTPHGMPMNMAHVNFGKPIPAGSPAPVIVDQWHVDSVDYVIVLILSDLSKTVGGELEVLHQKGVRDNANFMQNGVTAEMQKNVRSVKYPGAGYAIFMQGSQILHRVSPVLQADVARISCVWSYQSRNVFDHDTTRFHTFNHQDPRHVSGVEFARHTAWRTQGIMEHIMKEVAWNTPREELVALLQKASGSLSRAARLILEKEDDKLEWVDHEKVQSKL